jgi:hypothetical protein
MYVKILQLAQQNVVNNDTAALCRADALMQPIQHKCTPANTEMVASTWHAVPSEHTVATLNRIANLERCTAAHFAQMHRTSTRVPQRRDLKPTVQDQPTPWETLKQGVMGSALVAPTHTNPLYAVSDDAETGVPTGSKAPTKA